MAGPRARKDSDGGVLRGKNLTVKRMSVKSITFQPNATAVPIFRGIRSARSLDLGAIARQAGPRWVREDYGAGMRDVGELAERYAVSPAAMGFRLVNLGLN